MARGIADIRPDNAVFAVISFEGPDRYARAGGLGERVTELTEALAAQGFATHLIFVGDPNLPGREERLNGRLTLHRWCQWISKYYPEGVYAGEDAKLYDLNDSLPHYFFHEIARPAVAAGKLLVVLAEEWHTAEVLCRISDALYYGGIRHRAVLLWNANNVFSFHRVNWGRLRFVSGLLTVSKYMKHIMWDIGVNPLVVPNGVPERFFDPPDPAGVARLRQAFDGNLLLFKIGRFDPDKRWIMAVEAAARLKERNARPKFIIRGGIEPHGGEVLGHAASRGLRIQDVWLPDGSGCTGEIEAVVAARDADVINIRSFVSEEFKRTCYAAADATLANSGHEPFGIVGLEAMASGGVTFVGATGEDYAISFENSIVVETDDPEEIVGYIQFLCDHPNVVERVRAAARETAHRFTWNDVIENLLGKLRYLAVVQGVHA